MALSNHDPELPHVVVVGAGFAGLEVVKALRNAAVNITIVDRQNHHLFQPLLYQVASATLSPADIAWTIRAVFSRQKNVHVVMAGVTGVDPSRREVITDATAPIRYDFLVLAAGATHSYFGHDEWAPLAPGLKNLGDAIDIRGRLLTAYERAEIEPDSRKREQLLNFIIIGGGPTGVELAGAVADLARFSLAADFRSIDPRSSRITLIEAGPRILPALPAELSAWAQKSLESMGVRVRTSTMVIACDAHGVTTATGEHISGSTLIWAAGVQASPAGSWIGAATDRTGRIHVRPDLSVPNWPNIFAVGDTAHVTWHDSQTVPGIAPAAKQMGAHVGRTIAARLDGKPDPGPFRYRHQGDLATIGRKSAVVSIGRFRLKGFLAWLFWGVAHIYFLIGTRNRFSVTWDWIWEYLTLQRGARLITGQARKRSEDPHSQRDEPSGRSSSGTQHTGVEEPIEPPPAARERQSSG